nr:RNA-directed DNA polymerase, eukaryota, reverse transcriptase zinc-binding domain protein [Tanacetum cinerariifolium]
MLSVDFIKFLKESLDDFSRVLGLEPNMNKSTIFFGNVKLGDQRKNLNVVPFKVGKFPVKYLGVPLITKRLSREECKQLLDKGDLARGKAKISLKTFVSLNVKEHIEYKVGNGNMISVWYDKRNNIRPLCQIIDRRDLYNARFANDATVADMISNNQWIWQEEWNSSFTDLCNIQVLILNVNHDKTVWRCNDGSLKDFPVKHT